MFVVTIAVHSFHMGLPDLLLPSSIQAAVKYHEPRTSCTMTERIWTLDGGLWTSRDIYQNINWGGGGPTMSTGFLNSIGQDGVGMIKVQNFQQHLKTWMR